MPRAHRVLGLAFAAAVATAACTGGGDDDDDIASPSPTPTFVPTGCQVVWTSRASPPAPVTLVDAFVLDFPIAQFVVGTHQWGVTDNTFYEDFDRNTGSFSRSARVTSGTFVLAAAGSTSGGFVRFVDATPQAVWTLTTSGAIDAFQGTSGTGSFDGDQSDPYSTNVTPAIGSFRIVLGGTATTVGGDLAYAICYGPQSPLRPEVLR